MDNRVGIAKGLEQVIVAAQGAYVVREFRQAACEEAADVSTGTRDGDGASEKVTHLTHRGSRAMLRPGVGS
jgi:hypothetical protein